MSSEDKVNDVEISCQGIDMLVNNDWNGCEKLFAKYKDHSPLLNYCYSFISFMRAVMTFEEPLLEKAQKDLETTEKLCSSTDSTKMFSSLKRAFGVGNSASSSSSSSSSTSHSSKQEVTHPGHKQLALEDKFTKAIILADCKLYLAILTFIRQEASAFLSSGLLQIRKSWKMYARIQKQLYDIYKKIEPDAEHIYGSDPNSNLIQLLIEEHDEPEASSSSSSSNSNANSKSKSASDLQQQQRPLSLNELTISDDETVDGLSAEACKRLLGAVSFGYGLFQICLSFTPPNVLKLIKIFGFEGDRSVALKAINFTSNSRDMRAPFADMMLLWYSAIATPLFGVGEGEVLIGDEDTRLVLEKNLTKYSQSALFLYMKGKYVRTSQRDLAASLACFEQASEYSSHIREIQFISVYEIGWIHLQRLDYAKALDKFQVLHKASRWSRSFSTYICALLYGCTGQFESANAYVKEALKMVAAQSRKVNPIESFALRRNEHFRKHPIASKTVCELLVVELLYMWVCFPYCDESALKRMLETCDRITDKHLVPLKCLFEGSIQTNLKNTEFGEQCFNESIARAEDLKSPPFGKYVLPCSNFELASLYTNAQDFARAKQHVARARDNYKDYELENRTQTQIKSLQKRIKYLTDGPRLAAALKARTDTEKEQLRQKQAEEKNFFVH